MPAQSRSFLPVLAAGALAPALMLLHLAGFRLPGAARLRSRPRWRRSRLRSGSSAGADTAVFAGGCFWGVEAVFDHLTGVVDRGLGVRRRNARLAQLRGGEHRQDRAMPSR